VCEGEAGCDDETPLLQLSNKRASPAAEPLKAALKDPSSLDAVSLERAAFPAVARIFPDGDPTQKDQPIFNAKTGTVGFSHLSGFIWPSALVQYKICGLEPGTSNALHIHKKADFSEGCNSTGESRVFLGNVKVEEDGCAAGRVEAKNLPISKFNLNTIIGQSVVLYDQPGHNGPINPYVPAPDQRGEKIMCGPIAAIDGPGLCLDTCYLWRTGPSSADGGEPLQPPSTEPGARCIFYASQQDETGYRHCGVGINFVGERSIDCTPCGLSLQ